MVTTTYDLQKFADKICLLQTRKVATFFAVTLDQIDAHNFAVLMKKYAEFLHEEMATLEAKIDGHQ